MHFWHRPGGMRGSPGEDYEGDKTRTSESRSWSKKACRKDKKALNGNLARRPEMGGGALRARRLARIRKFSKKTKVVHFSWFLKDLEGGAITIEFAIKNDIDSCTQIDF